MRIGKKGFTLVEVIVSLAIMTIVAGSVGAFIVAGNNSYLRGNKELTLQEEAQLAANQMIDLIIDVEKEIKFTKDHPGTAVDLDGNTAKDAAGNEITTAHVSELLLVNNENTYMIRWQGTASGDYATANQVYLYEVKNTTDADGNLVVGDPTTATPALMAEHVTSFSVDLSQVKDKRKVILNMTFTYQDRSYDIAETIKLRNDLEKTGTNYSWISGLVIKPEHAEVALGGSKQFEYSLSGDEEAVAQGVEWKVTKADGTACKSTIKADGTLIVKEDEDLGENELLVTCTAVADPTLKATATVSVIEYISLKINPTTATVEQNSVFTFSYELEASSNEVKNGGVKWKLDGATSNDTWINPTTGELHVSENETPGTAVLTVTCTVNKRQTVTATALVTVIEKSNIIDKYDATLIASDLFMYEFTEGSTRKVGYKGIIECLPSWADYLNGFPQIEWSVPKDYNHSYKITGITDADGRQFKAELECGNNNDTVVYVEAKVKLSADVTVILGINIVIPPLNTIQSADKPYISADIDENDTDKNKLGQNGFVLNRNGRIKVSIVNYTDDNNKPKDVLWRFADMPAELDNTFVNQDGKVTESYLVGLGAYHGSYDSDNGQNFLLAENTGSSTEVWALKTVDWNKDYHLKLQAWSVDGKNLIAETIILVPKVEFLFDNNEHVYKVKVPHYYNPPLRLDMYGIENDADKLIAPFVVDMDAIIQGDEALADDTELGTISPWETSGSWIGYRVTGNENNKYLIVTVYAYKTTADKEADKAIVKQYTEQYTREHQSEIDDLKRGGDSKKTELKFLMDSINVDANKERKNYMFKRNFLMVLQKENK